MAIENYVSRERGLEVPRLKGLAAAPELGPEITFAQWNVFHGSESGVLIDIFNNEIFSSSLPVIVTLQEVATDRNIYQPDNLLEVIKKETDLTSFAYSPTHVLIPREGENAGKEVVKDGILIASTLPFINSEPRTIELSRNKAYDSQHDGERYVPYIEVGVITGTEEQQTGGAKPITIGTSHRSIWMPENVKNGTIKQESQRMNNAVRQHSDNYVCSMDFNALKIFKPVRSLPRNVRRINGGLAKVTCTPPYQEEFPDILHKLNRAIQKIKGTYDVEDPDLKLRIDHMIATHDVKVFNEEVVNPEGNPSDHGILRATLQQTLFIEQSSTH